MGFHLAQHPFILISRIGVDTSSAHGIIITSPCWLFGIEIKIFQPVNNAGVYVQFLFGINSGNKPASPCRGTGRAAGRTGTAGSRGGSSGREDSTGGNGRTACTSRSRTAVHCRTSCDDRNGGIRSGIQFVKHSLDIAANAVQCVVDGGSC